jgi:translation initiation factor 6
LEIEFADLNGNIHIGVSILCTENYALVPIETPDTLVNLIESTMKVNTIKLAERIIGSLVLGNSNGFIISNVVAKEVVEQIESTNLPVYQAPEFFAFGNVVLANDFGGIISPIVPPEIRESIQRILKVPLATNTIANSDLVGSLAYITNYGGLFTPLADEEEVNKLKGLLNLQEIGVGSVNKGSEFIASGIIGNSKGMLIGRETTGIEIMEITRCFSS